MAEIGAITITTLADRPELTERLDEIDDGWPPFLIRDLVSEALSPQVGQTFPHYCVVATTGARVVGRALAVPYDAGGAGREELPDQGWDRILVWAFEDHRDSTEAASVGALEIVVDTEFTGQGMAGHLLAALADAVGKQGHDTLLVPLRPTDKQHQPYTPIAEYIRQTRDDGLPFDPWLRVHIRAGGRIEKIAPASMTITGSLGQWREWTGLPFDRTGTVEVPGALVPVYCDTVHDYAVYAEPNIWIRHPLPLLTPN